MARARRGEAGGSDRTALDSFSALRDRLADQERHLCHDQIDDTELAGFEGALVEDDRTPVPERHAPVGRAAIRVAQMHLVCDGLLAADAVDERLGPGTSAALATFRRRHMVAQAEYLDQETRALLVPDTRELDFRGLLRSLRERVVNASGLIEDGSVRGAWESVLERAIDPAGIAATSGTTIRGRRPARDGVRRESGGPYWSSTRDGDGEVALARWPTTIGTGSTRNWPAARS